MHQGEPLLTSRKRPLPMEKGVSLFAVFCSQLTRHNFFTHQPVYYYPIEY
ncbi:hypothetical protein HMPREF0973_00498 [Prevotella veroralis F0319]|uniref:Uncharacterized protein n=1 Tax=Prevotella veroralis F0319 TaxID=649761 RepID=C9MLM3_9BACT|nr:hypothetical protein HMPREF0973_00498 [Prevotella veroralis F0319]